MKQPVSGVVTRAYHEAIVDRLQQHIAVAYSTISNLELKCDELLRTKVPMPALEGMEARVKKDQELIGKLCGLLGLPLGASHEAIERELSRSLVVAGQIPAGSATERIVKENIVVEAVRSLCGMRPDASMSDLLIALRGRFDAHTKNVLDTMDDLNDALRLLGLDGVGAGRSPREVFRDVVLPRIAELQRRAPMPYEIGAELADAHAGLLARVGDRLRATASAKGLALQPGSILGTIDEVQQEVADIVGWSSVLWARIERLRTAPVWRLPVSEPKQVST